MRTNSITVICGALIALAIGTSSVWAQKAVPQTPLTEAGQKLETRYADQLERLRTELTAKVPQNDQNMSSCSKPRLKAWQSSPSREKSKRRWSRRCWRTPIS